MTRLIMGAIVLAVAAAGCSGSGTERSPEAVASAQQPAVAQRLCRSFDAYTAAIAEATIDCRGAIGPSDYAVDPQTQLLAPTFKECPAEPTPKPPQVSALNRIKSVLSIQDPKRPKTPLPDGTFLELRCLRDAYVDYVKNNAAALTGSSPNWHKQFAGGVPTKERMKALASRFPKPFLTKDQAWAIHPEDAQPGSGFRFPKTYFFYTVSWDSKPPQRECGATLIECARRFAGMFEGFFVGRFGKYVVGDPYEWLDPTVYDDWASNDPYRVNGYYHPMSLTGDGHRPGPIYGDYARAKLDEATDPDGNAQFPPADPDPESELCTRYDGTDHRIGRLVQDRLGDPDQWLSVCEFWPLTGVNPFTLFP